ncbi:pilus assembly protein TadB [Paenibacillus piri]|uniref:Pilus assembly protein TadB n=2 Tax=Paenibacillus piri TaxID=2547395 RepID=A0A4V2ZU78_9BACL|nr:pilus assembly protein TadB [Paenibacillus piri]
MLGGACWIGWTLLQSQRIRRAALADTDVKARGKRRLPVSGWPAAAGLLRGLSAGRKPAGTLPLSHQQLPGTGLIDYNEYAMTPRQKFLSAVIAAGCLACIGFIFYNHWFGALVLSAAGLYYPVIRRKQLIRKRRNQLQLQFKQALASISSALGAGKSVEIAFLEALSDLRLLYPDPQALIVKELETINRRLENGETIETALNDLSGRSGLDDIQQFTEVFVICKRTGGNLVQVMRRTASIIQEKLDIQQDIQVMLAQKRFESKILAFAPLVVIAVLSFSSPDYMEPMYKGAGRLIMSVSLLILAGCYMVTQLIMNIKV